MTRTLTSLALFVCLLSASPTLAVVLSGGAGGVSLDVGGDVHLASGRQPTALAPARGTDCERFLRGFLGRNTLRPSERRQALRRCQDETGDSRWAAQNDRAPTP